MRRRGQRHVVFGDGADVAVNDFEGNFFRLDLLERLDDGLDRTLGVGLDDDLEPLALRRIERREQIFERDLGAVFQILAFRSIARCSARSRAAFSSSTTLNSRPASGTPFKPSTFTATDGPASLSRLPSSLISARTRPKIRRTR